MCTINPVKPVFQVALDSSEEHQLEHARSPQQSFSPGSCAACVAGLSIASMATCNGSDGTNATVPGQNYTCNTGYYVAAAPAYCKRMRNTEGLH
jgi:hypothetical protein